MNTAYNPDNNVWNLFKLDGKIALVIGGARHLGFDMALALAEAGADVAVTSRSAENARRAAADIAEITSRRTYGFALDVCDEAMVEQVVDEVIAQDGPDRYSGQQRGQRGQHPGKRPVLQASPGALGRGD